MIAFKSKKEYYEALGKDRLSLREWINSFLESKREFNPDMPNAQRIIQKRTRIIFLEHLKEYTPSIIELANPRSYIKYLIIKWKLNIPIHTTRAQLIKALKENPIYVLDSSQEILEPDKSNFIRFKNLQELNKFKVAIFMNIPAEDMSVYHSMQYRDKTYPRRYHDSNMATILNPEAMKI